MDEQLKYPIMYAVLELKERGGWAAGYEDITQGFIVSKCYVIGSTTVYLSNGQKHISYKVIFPYTDIEHFKKSSYDFATKSLGTRNTPSPDRWGNRWNIDTVLELFDNYEATNELATRKNKEMKKKLILNFSISDTNWKSKFEDFLKDFDKRLSICQDFEKMVSAETVDMEISPI